MRMAWRNFTRNRRATIVSALAAAALAGFLLIFSHNIRASEAELDNAYDTIPVSAYIAGSSATQAPRIGETLYGDILGCGFVASSRAAAQYGVRTEDTLRALDHIDATMVMVGKEIYGRNAWDESEREVEEDYNADN